MTLFSFFCSIIFRTLAISSVTILDLRSVIYACKSFYVSWHPFPIDDMILRKDSNESNRLISNFKFGSKTSNHSLRSHIEVHHQELYLRLAKEKGWKVMLPGVLRRARAQVQAAANESDHLDDEQDP